MGRSSRAKALSSASSQQAYQILHPHNALKNSLCVRVVRFVVHDPRAVDEEDPLHECDVLPNLGFTRNRRDFAHLQIITRLEVFALTDERSLGHLARELGRGHLDTACLIVCELSVA